MTFLQRESSVEPPATIPMHQRRSSIMRDSLFRKKTRKSLAEEDAMKIEIPQYASQSKTCASLETTLEEIKWQTIFDEKSTSDCDPKGKRQQQPQTSTTQSHGSRSVFQIVPIYHLMQEMLRGLIVNNLYSGTV